jgi:hypothetical protein
MSGQMGDQPEILNIGAKIYTKLKKEIGLFIIVVEL